MRGEGGEAYLLGFFRGSFWGSFLGSFLGASFGVALVCMPWLLFRMLSVLFGELLSVVGYAGVLFCTVSVR